MKFFSFIFDKLKYSFSPRGLNAIFAFLFLFIVVYRVLAATPNPGHPWTEIGDGLITFSTPSAWHTYTLPDGTSTIMTTRDINQGDIIYGSAASTTAVLPKDTNATRYLSNTGASNNPLWALINLTNGVTGILTSTNGGTGNGFTKFSGPTTAEKTFTLPDVSSTILTSNAPVTLAQGGTNASLTASNGGIFYSTATAGAILSGTSTAGLMLRSGTGSAPSWSQAAFPNTAGASTSVMVSNGTNFVSQDQTILTVPTRAFGATGAMTATAMSSLTVFKVGMFNVPAPIVVNAISTSITTVTTAGTMKRCIYDQAGNKIIDTTSAAPAANATLTTTLGAPVTLKPGNYYIAIGCATTCNDTVNYWTTTTASPLTTLTPTGKKVYEGTVTMTSGTCNATLPTITAVISSTPVGRLDN